MFLVEFQSLKNASKISIAFVLDEVYCFSQLDGDKLQLLEVGVLCFDDQPVTTQLNFHVEVVVVDLAASFLTINLSSSDGGSVVISSEWEVMVDCVRSHFQRNIKCLEAW